AHGRCSERTARRAMASLIERGLIEIAVRSAPGRRAVYRMLPLPGSPAERGTTVLAHVEPVDNPANVGQADIERGPNPAQRGPQPLASPLSHPLVISPLSSPNGSESPAEVEGGGSGGRKPDLHTRRGTEQARMVLADKLTEWMRARDPGTGEQRRECPA